MIVIIQIPKDSSGMLITHATWRGAISAAIAILKDIHGRRRARGLPELRLKALLDEAVPMKAPPGRYKLHRRYRISLDNIECHPIVKPVDPWRPKPAAKPEEKPE